MNNYKITWFDKYSHPQLSFQIIQAESYKDAKSYAIYKLNRDGIKDRQLYNLEPAEKQDSDSEISLLKNIVDMLMQSNILLSELKEINYAIECNTDKLN